MKGFRNHDKGNTFRTIEKVLNDLDFEVNADVLNSKHFGVPQNRERFFIVAWHRKQIKAENFNFPFGLDENDKVIFDKTKRDILAKKISVGDILLKNNKLLELEIQANKTYTISEKLWAGTSKKKTRA